MLLFIVNIVFLFLFSPHNSCTLHCSCQNTQILCQPPLHSHAMVTLCNINKTCGQHALQMIIFGIKKISLSENYFQNLTNLESLKISNTKSLIIQPASLKPLKNLKYLELTNNNLSQCNRTNLSHLSQLSILNFNNNFLDDLKLKNCLPNHQNLRKLYLQNNNIKILLPETFQKVPNLITLDLKNNPIEKFDLKHCSNLANLYLSNSNLKTIKTIKHLSALKHINIDGNQRQIGLVPGMFAHTLVEIIRFKDVQLGSIPGGWLQQCYFLSELKLDNVGMTNIPVDMFADTNNLSKLILSNNNISVLYQSLFSSMDLETLEIVGNRIKILNSQFLVGFRRLEFLSLRNTSVSSNHVTKATDLLRQVDQIDLSFNNLNGSLNMTGLARNHLKIDFSNNNITRFLFNPYTNFTNFEILIDNNPLVCDCSSQDLLTVLENLLETTKPRDVLSRNEASKKYVMQTCGNLSCSLPDIMNNPCPHPCSCYYNSMAKVVTMDCRNKNLSSIITIVNNVSMPTEAKTLCVYMQGNMITNVTSNDIRRILIPVSAQEVELYLSDNLVNSLELDWLPDNLRLLYLDRNNLVSLSRDLIKTLENNKSSLRLRLSKNPFRCDCMLSRFVIANTDIIEDGDDMSCKEENMGYMQVVEYESSHCYDTIPYYILSIVVLFITCIAALYSCRIYTPVQLTLYISYAPEDKVLAARIQEDLVSYFPNISILTWEDAAPGEVIYCKHFILITKANLHDSLQIFFLLCILTSPLSDFPHFLCLGA